MKVQGRWVHEQGKPLASRASQLMRHLSESRTVVESLIVSHM